MVASSYSSSCDTDEHEDLDDTAAVPTSTNNPDYTWAVLSHVYSAADLKNMGLKEEFDWSAPPPKKFKRVKIPPLVASSYSSSRDTDEYEDLDDTAAGPTTTNNPDNAGAPPST